MDTVIREILDDIQFGERDIKIDAMGRLEEIAQGQLDIVRPVVLNAMDSGDGAIQLIGAVTLAKLGDGSEDVIEVLIGNLSPPRSENENIIKYYAVEGLSYIKGIPEIVNILLNTAQYDENIGVRNGAIYALGAIGDPAAINFLEYQNRRGNTSAKIALELFGEADFHTINSLDGIGDDARKCTACGYLGVFKTTILGKKKCPQCGKTN